MVSWPPVLIGALVSLMWTWAPVMTAASLVPSMVTLTLEVVPSALVTVKVSVSDWPTLSWL